MDAAVRVVSDDLRQAVIRHQPGGVVNLQMRQRIGVQPLPSNSTWKSAFFSSVPCRRPLTWMTLPVDGVRDPIQRAPDTSRGLREVALHVGMR